MFWLPCVQRSQGSTLYMLSRISQNHRTGNHSDLQLYQYYIGYSAFNAKLSCCRLLHRKQSKYFSTLTQQVTRKYKFSIVAKIKWNWLIRSWLMTSISFEGETGASKRKGMQFLQLATYLVVWLFLLYFWWSLRIEMCLLVTWALWSLCSSQALSQYFDVAILYCWWNTLRWNWINSINISMVEHLVIILRKGSHDRWE